MVKKMTLRLGMVQPCPFCRSQKLRVQKLIRIGSGGKLDHAVYCMNCGAYGPKHKTRQSALRDWGIARRFSRG